MNALRRLRKLHLIPDQDDIARAHSHCDDMGQRHLPSFVDEKVVEALIQLVVSKEPGRPGNQIVIAGEYVAHFRSRLRSNRRRTDDRLPNSF